MVILIIKGVKVQKVSIYTIMYYLYVLLCIILTRLEGVKTAENLNIEKFFKMLVFIQLLFDYCYCCLGLAIPFLSISLLFFHPILVYSILFLG